MVEVKKRERTNALKVVKRLCKKSALAAEMLKSSLTAGRKKS